MFSSLTIRARITLLVAAVGISFSVFMSLFFPAQALDMGNRLLGDSAVTLSAVFAGNIEPAFGTLGFGGEDMLTTAIKQLTSTTGDDDAGAGTPGATAGAGRPGAAVARDGDAGTAGVDAQPMTVTRVTVWDATGTRLAGYGDEAAARRTAKPVETLVIESGRDTLAVTAPVRRGDTLQGFFTIEVSKRSFNTLVSRNRWAAIVASAIALALICVVGALVSRSIVRRIHAVVGALDRVAEGDLTVTIDVRSNDEVGQMGRALDRTLDAMRSSLARVRELANTVAVAAQHLSASSEKISAGTQQQAASTEETASSLEEMTSTIKQNADNADQAKQASENARTVADEGGRVVQQAVQAVGEINTASRRIGDIIGTVDDIAFQTNLLALNAAVEAARAGDQGRGFAVVAAEVRTLAQRSATAAKEIKALIKDSLAKVDRGSSLVHESGKRLEQIVNAVSRTTSIVAEIAAASREQAAGVDQVNRALSQIDAVTQANASKTGDLSGTAQSLAGQADQLQALVARFRLDAEAAERGGEGRRAGGSPAAGGSRGTARRDAGRAHTAAASQAPTPRGAAADGLHPGTRAFDVLPSAGFEEI